MRDTRIHQMKQYIFDHRHVSMEELCRHFHVSMNTVRRDLAELADLGMVRKVYGGVISCEKKTLREYYERNNCFAEEKKRIGAAAAELVEDHDVIFADSGTIVFRMIPYIRAKQVTVITASLSAMNEASVRENIRLVVLPGSYHAELNAVSGAEAAEYLRRYHLNKAFLAAAGWTMEQGATHASTLEYELKRAALLEADRKILMIDSSKIGSTAIMKYAVPEELDLLITDRMPEEMAETCRERGLKVMLC